MKIKIGCDLVNIERFSRSVRNGGQAFLDRVFSSHELANSPSMESRAGVFAVKESVIKALKLGADQWKKIEVIKNKDGIPEVQIADWDLGSQDISISHDSDYAFAVAAFLIE